MLSRANIYDSRGNMTDSYIDTPANSYFFHTKRREVTNQSRYTSNSPTQHILCRSKNYKSNNRRRFRRKDSSISMTLKSKKGTSFIEVVVAMLILSILIIGAHHHFVHGRGQIALRRNYRAALQLAAQKLEELKAGNYNDITVGKTEETLTLGEHSCSRSTDANDVGLYKRISVGIQWNQMGKEHNVSLDTFIAPK